MENNLNKHSYLSLSNIPTISRHVSELNGDQFPLCSANLNSSAVILPLRSESTDYNRTKDSTLVLVYFSKFIMIRYSKLIIV